MVNHRDVLIWLNCISGIAGTRIQALLQEFPHSEDIVHASLNDLMRVNGIGNELAQRICSSDFNELVEGEYSRAEKHNISIITQGDSAYPAVLHDIPSPPPVLYYRGTLKPQDSLAMAIVGSRRCSTYGRLQTAKISRELSRAGFTIVSGCALGIDGVAHSEAIRVKGRTIGIMPSGLLKPYPPEHYDLIEKIAEHGAIISEFHLNQKVERGSFVRRNRLISGLSLGVLVTEAYKRSGALITARYAQEQGREVFALPGNVDSPQSRGTHKLIRDGATLIEHARDIISELRPLITQALNTVSQEDSDTVKISLHGTEKTVFDALSSQPVHIDTLISTTGLSAAEVSSRLTLLQMRNIIQEVPGKKYVRL